MLDLMRKNRHAVQDNLVSCAYLLQQASEHFTILDPELGDEELVKSVGAELARLTAFKAENSQQQ